MRIYLKLSKTKELIPHNYQPFLTGAIHKWLGVGNEYHGRLSLYSFSWLQNVRVSEKGVFLTEDSYWFISAHNEQFIKSIINGIMNEPFVCYGAYVTEVQIVETPIVSGQERFVVASPVFIKRKMENRDLHITFDDKNSAQYLTEALQNKLVAAGLPSGGVKVSFDSDFARPKTKIIYYKEIGNKVNVCPVIVEGTPEQVAFAWNVGVGNSTGIGFGALK